MIRQPAVSGQFYPAVRSELLSQVDSMLVGQQHVREARAIIVPHAGYIYSGRIAGQVFAETRIPNRILMIGPNHHGRGADISLSAADAWKTPLGDVPVDESLRRKLIESVPGVTADDDAHEFEHSLEVMLPFLQVRREDISIVPIALGRLGFEDCRRLGDGIAEVLTDLEDDVLLLASSDMNHFSSADVNKKLDEMAIAAMTDYDLEQLYEVVTRNRISMCGVLPVLTVMQAARTMGAAKCELIGYAHSGLVNGDNSSVVGYAGLTIT